jgi:uncharacterized membrane protein
LFSDLIIAFMPDENDACVLRKALQTMRKQRLLGVDRSVALSRDPAGGFRLCRADEAAVEGHDSLAELIAIAQWLFGQAAPFQGDGFDGVFLAAVARSWHDSASALLFLIRRDGLSDTDELRRVLSLFHTRICETSLSVEAEAKLNLTVGTGDAFNRSRHQETSGSDREHAKASSVLRKGEDT